MVMETAPRATSAARDAREVLTWDQTFLMMAQVAAGRSKDPSTQVGACIASADNRVLSVGYNGAPRGFEDDDFPWGKAGATPLETKFAFVVHAERNAILNFRGSLREFAGATLYVTHAPCNECAKEIAQVGIGRVVFAERHGGGHLGKASEIILERAGVTLEHLRLEVS